MKKLLTILAVLGISFTTTAAEPADLHAKILNQNTQNKSGVWGYEKKGRHKIHEESYDLSLIATEYVDVSDSTSCLHFDIKDDSTRVIISDFDINGLSENDCFFLRHCFQNNDVIQFVIEYKADNDYILAGLFYEKGDAPYGPLYIDTKDLKPLLRLFAKKKIKPIIEYGKRAYHDLVATCLEGNKPVLPYKDTKNALREMDKFLDMLKQEEGYAAWIELGEKYAEICSTKKR